MQHPDKSLNAALFIRTYARLLADQTDMKLIPATIEAMAAWKKSKERAELMHEYKSRGFALGDSARELRESGGKPPPLKASLFEIALRRRR